MTDYRDLYTLTFPPTEYGVWMFDTNELLFKRIDLINITKNFFINYIGLLNHWPLSITFRFNQRKSWMNIVVNWVPFNDAVLEFCILYRKKFWRSNVARFVCLVIMNMYSKQKLDIECKIYNSKTIQNESIWHNVHKI